MIAIYYGHWPKHVLGANRVCAYYTLMDI